MSIATSTLEKLPKIRFFRQFNWSNHSHQILLMWQYRSGFSVEAVFAILCCRLKSCDLEFVPKTTTPCCCVRICSTPSLLLWTFSSLLLLTLTLSPTLFIFLLVNIPNSIDRLHIHSLICFTAITLGIAEVLTLFIPFNSNTKSRDPVEFTIILHRYILRIHRYVPSLVCIIICFSTVSSHDNDPLSCTGSRSSFLLGVPQLSSHTNTAWSEQAHTWHWWPHLQYRYLHRVAPCHKSVQNQHHVVLSTGPVE